MIRLIAVTLFALAACSVLDAPVAQLERWQKQSAAGAMAAIADEPVVPDCAPGRGEPCQRLPCRCLCGSRPGCCLPWRQRARSGFACLRRQRCPGGGTGRGRSAAARTKTPHPGAALCY